MRNWKLLLIGLCSFAAISLALNQIHYTRPVGKPIKIALLQPSIFSSKNYNEQTLYDIEMATMELLGNTRADIFVLPETVFGTDYHYLAYDYLSKMQDIARINNAEILFGSPIFINEDSKFTGTLKLGDLNNPLYIKHNLVPFGEYNPLKHTFLAPLVTAVSEQISNFQPGTSNQAPVLIKGQKFAFNICYENTINDFVANSSRNANIILNQSDLSWYGETGMKDAFLQFSQGRALENQRYFLQDGNTGDTVAINQLGQIESRIAPFTAGALVHMVQGYAGVTPFELLHNYPIWILCLLSMLIAVVNYFLSSKHHQAA